MGRVSKESLLSRLGSSCCELDLLIDKAEKTFWIKRLWVVQVLWMGRNCTGLSYYLLYWIFIVMMHWLLNLFFFFSEWALLVKLEISYVTVKASRCFSFLSFPKLECYLMPQSIYVANQDPFNKITLVYDLSN